MLGYIAVEGASSLLFQQIRNLGDRKLEPGLPLKLVWSEEEVEHPMELFWFEPS